MILENDGTTLGRGGLAFGLTLRDQVKGQAIIPKGRTFVVRCLKLVLCV